MRGLDDAREFRLVAHKGGHADSEPVTCERGQTELTLVLRSWGSLIPTLEWSDGDPHDFFKLELRRAGEASTYRTAGVRGFPHLPPGHYDLLLWLRGAEQLILTLPSLLVSIAEPCTDTRLHPIRLDGRLSLVSLTVLDPEGSPLPGATAGMTDRDRARGGGEPWRAEPEESGRIAIPSPLQGSVTVRAPGCRALEIPPPIGNETVTLQWFRPVTLRLPAAFPADSEYWLRLVSPPPPQVVAEEVGEGRFSISITGRRTQWSRLLAPGEIDGREIHPPGLGPFSATWYHEDSLTSEEPEACGTATFLVPEGQGTLEIVLPMPVR